MMNVTVLGVLIGKHFEREYSGAYGMERMVMCTKIDGNRWMYDMTHRLK